MTIDEVHYPVVTIRRQALTKNISLERGEVKRLNKNSGVRTIKVKSGVIWITGTPADGDILLQRGESLELRNQWPYVLEALEKTEAYYL